MYLGIRTDSPMAKFYLYEGETCVATHEWQADRELAKGLLGKLEAFLADHNVGFDNIKGLLVFRGPGSFTGLRIGLTVMNTAAYALNVPIVGSEEEDWIQTSITKLEAGGDDRIVLPLYGAEARITKAKK